MSLRRDYLTRSSNCHLSMKSSTPIYRSGVGGSLILSYNSAEPFRTGRYRTHALSCFQHSSRSMSLTCVPRSTTLASHASYNISLVSLGRPKIASICRCMFRALRSMPATRKLMTGDASHDRNEVWSTFGVYRASMVLSRLLISGSWALVTLAFVISNSA